MNRSDDSCFLYYCSSKLGSQKLFRNESGSALTSIEVFLKSVLQKAICDFINVFFLLCVCGSFFVCLLVCLLAWRDKLCNGQETQLITMKYMERRTESLKSKIPKEECINFQQKQKVEENV